MIIQITYFLGDISMLVIAPTLNGHYKTYFNRLYRDGDEFILIEKIHQIFNPKNLSRIFFHREILFLHGERQAIVMIVMGMTLFWKNISTILYYSFFDDSFKVKMAYRVFRVLGIQLHALEYRDSCRPFLHYLPDPITMRGLFDYECLHSDDTFVFLVAGYLDERKSVIEISSALNEVGLQGYDVTLILVGEQSVGLKRMFDPKRYPFVKFSIIDRRVSDDELHDYICNSSAVLAIYKDHLGSSGFVINSVALNVPVLFVPVGVLKSYERMVLFQSLPETFSEKAITKALLDFVLYKENYYDVNLRMDFIENHDLKKFVGELRYD